MNKKKLLMPLSIALAFLTIVLASCGGKNDDNDKTVTSNDTTTVESSTATDTSTNTSTSTQTSTSTETSTSTSTSTSTQTSTSTETSTSTQTSTSTDTTTSTDITTSTSTSSNTSTSSSQPTTTTTSEDPGVQKFNITYLDKNNNPIDDIGDNPTTISENDGIVVFNNISKTGYTFDGFYTDKQLTNKITQIDSSTIAEDFALYVSFTAIRYNVTFDAGIGTNQNTFTTYSIESDTITLLDATVSEGYTFDGWYDSNNQKVTQIVHGSTGDITLTAKYNKVQYTITLDAGTGEVSSTTINYDIETAVTLPDATPANGYRFLGWYTQGGTKLNSIPAGTKGDMTLTARYEIIQYQVVFNNPEGTKVSPRSYTVVTGMSELPIAVRGDLDFEGWYDNENFLGDPITSIPVGTIGDIELYAKFSGQFFITYDIPEKYATNNGGNPEAVTPSTDFTLKAPGGEQNTNKYEFEGWYTTSTFAENSKITVLNNTTVTTDLTLYAHFIPKVYNITYKYYDTNLMNEYHTASEITSSSIVNNNRTSYDADEESFDLSSVSLEGYTFDGFYTAEPKLYTDQYYSYYAFTESNKVTTYTFPDYKIDLIIYVSLKPVEHEVTLKYDGNDYMTIVTYYGDEAITIEDNKAMPCKVGTGYQVLTLIYPTKTGYTFDGWYDANNQKLTSIPANLSTNLTYTAKMNEISYSISYDVNGGKAVNNTITSFTITTETITLNDATPHDGYLFDGWYNESEQKITSIPLGTTGDISLQARYVIENYTITYDLAGGSYQDDEENPTSYNIESEDITLFNPIKQGYNFLGWYDSNNQKVEIIASGSTGNITLTASWEEKLANTITYIYGINNYSNYKAGEFTEAQAEAFGLPTSYTHNTESLQFTTFSAKGFIFSANNWQIATVDDSGYITTTGISVTLEALISLGEDVILYQPSPNYKIYTITYKLDGEDFNYPDESATTFNLGTNGSEDIYFISNYDGYDYSWYADSEMTESVMFLGDLGITNPEDIKDVTIYGTRVQHIDTYNISYVLGHGSFSGTYPTSFTNLQSATLVNPVADTGYEFEGWYDSNNQKVTVIDVDHYSSDVTLIARYNLIEYTITYVATNCTNPNTVTSYNIESETITILDAEANDGYEFNCWKDASNNVVTSIAHGSTGNITLTADVTVITYTITYIYENIDTGDIIEESDGIVLNDPNPTTYTVEGGEIIFDEITLASGYTFGGWYMMDGDEQEAYGIINPDDDIYIIGIQSGVAVNLEIHIEIFED